MADVNGPPITVVTGGHGGIGSTLSRAFADRGDTVVIIDSAPGAASSPYPYYEVDVRDAVAVEAALAEIESRHGATTVLVNCAGVMSREPALDVSIEEWNRVIGINLTGTFVCAMAAARRMKQRRRGWILNIGSIWARYVWPSRAAYSASKAAVEHLTRCLALELAEYGIVVNACSPGLMATDMTKDVLSSEAFKQTFMHRLPTGHAGSAAHDLVPLALLLTSADATYMSGEVMNVHGGYY